MTADRVSWLVNRRHLACPSLLGLQTLGGCDRLTRFHEKI